MVISEFTSFYTVIHSYQDDWKVIMEAVYDGSPFTIEKIATVSGALLWIR